MCCVKLEYAYCTPSLASSSGVTSSITRPSKFGDGASCSAGAVRSSSSSHVDAMYAKGSRRSGGGALSFAARSGGAVFATVPIARKPRPQDDVPPGLNSEGSAGTVGSGVDARSEAFRASRTAGGVSISRQGGSSASSAAARAACLAARSLSFFFRRFRRFFWVFVGARLGLSRLYQIVPRDPVQRLSDRSAVLGERHQSKVEVQ